MQQRQQRPFGRTRQGRLLYQYFISKLSPQALFISAVQISVEDFGVTSSRFIYLEGTLSYLLAEN
jgi:hypothetical protein